VKDASWLKLKTEDPVVKFMWKARNRNIHRTPTSPRIEGDVLVDGMFIVGPSVKHAPAPERVSYRSYFDNWAGPESVVQLCADYLPKLLKLVEEATQAGKITRTP
jgi:hypothetical protein